MTKITIKAPNFRRQVTLIPNEDQDGAWVASMNGHEPLDIQADTMHEALMKLQLLAGSFRLTAEARAMREIARRNRQARFQVEGNPDEPTPGGEAGTNKKGRKRAG